MLAVRSLRRPIGLAVLLGLVATIPAAARDLTYQPVSPAFGGSPLNGSYVLGLAATNNYRYTQNPATRSQNSAGRFNSVEQFRDQITASLLSQIASSIGQQIIGENARDSGTFNLSGTIVQFNRAGGQINVDITDAATGGRTLIQIPAPQF